MLFVPEGPVTTPLFVHLHCHSHYSLLDVASPIKGMIGRAQELGMNSLVITGPTVGQFLVGAGMNSGHSG